MSRGPAPRLSVITVCKNARATLPRCLASVFSQSYQDFEYLVFDGGSTDGTVALLEACDDPRLRAWDSQPDGGIYPAMNRGLAAARGDFVLFLNADDYFLGPEALASFAAGLKEEGIVYYGCAAVRWRGKTLYHRPAAGAPDLGPLSVHNLPIHQSLAVPRALAQAVAFDPAFEVAADHAHQLALLARAPFAYVPVELVAFELGGTSSFAPSLARFRRHLQEHLRLLGEEGWRARAYIRLSFWGKFLLSRLIPQNLYFAVYARLKQSA